MIGAHSFNHKFPYTAESNVFNIFYRLLVYLVAFFAFDSLAYCFGFSAPPPKINKETKKERNI